MFKFLILASTLIGFSLSVAAQNAPPTTLPKKKAPIQEWTEASNEDAGSSGSGDGYKFNTSGSPKNSDTRSPLKFKVPQTESELKDTKAADPVANTPNDEPFRTYVGYPKHQISLDYSPVTVNSKWSYKGQDFNYTSNSSSSFGLLYRFVATPKINVEVGYSTYTVSVNDSQVLPYTINKSDVSVDSLFARLNYFWISDSNFFHRWGPGFELGYDSYPILNFVSSNELEISKVKDLVYGVNFNYQFPLISTILFQLKVGYNMGSGAGNSGDLTSKTNNSSYFDANIDWSITEHHGVNIGVDYRVRKASIDGKNGNNVDTWDTTATNTTAKISYIYTF